MIEFIELTCGSSARLPVGTLSRSPGGRVSITTTSGTSRIVDTELADPAELFVAIHPRGLLALGEESHSLLGWDATSTSLSVLGSTARLDLTGYDPGGLKRVRMHAVSDDLVMLETEVGFSLVDLTDSVVWTRVHDDLTVRIDGIGDGVVRVISESAASQFSVADGSYLGGEPHG